MRQIICIFRYCVFLFPTGILWSQPANLHRVLEDIGTNGAIITGITQDAQGYIWFSTLGAGVYQYSGDDVKSYTSDSLNQNSLASDQASCLVVDSSGYIWIGTMGHGLDRFDPSNKTFTHFRNDKKNASSLANDSISTILVDHANNLWVGTRRGLELLERTKGSFKHFVNNKDDKSSLSNDHVFSIYEDRQQTIWVGCGLPFFGTEKIDQGGLNKLDRTTGKFTRFMHDDGDANSLSNNHVTSIFEDSKGNFWIGTEANGLNKMDRNTGKFFKYTYDSKHPDRLSAPPLLQSAPTNYTTFITEDIEACLWIGSTSEGMNRFDPTTERTTHYGYIYQVGQVLQADISTGFAENTNTPFRAFSSKEGLFWIGSAAGNLYNSDLSRTRIPYHAIRTGANSFYEDGENILWIATDAGLYSLNRKDGIEKRFVNDPKNPNSINLGVADGIRSDTHGNLWIATNGGGLSKFNPSTNLFTRYRHDDRNASTIAGDALICIDVDRDDNLWLGISGQGVDKMNIATGGIIHYQHKEGDSNSIVNNDPNCICQDSQLHSIWIGTQGGLDRLDKTTNQFYHYLSNVEILSICVDAAGDVWAGTARGLFKLDKQKNLFVGYKSANLPGTLRAILNIMEDDKKNLWLSCSASLIKINPERNQAIAYGKRYGIRVSNFYLADNYKARNGELFFGDDSGYYAFFPERLGKFAAPGLSISSFRLGDNEEFPGTGVLNQPIWSTKEIRLNYRQNTFSFDFSAIDYSNSGRVTYFFKLENYDDSWHDLGTDHKAFFFKLPPGHYIFHAKIATAEGLTRERTLDIVIHPPWWRTGWAYALYGLSFLIVLFIANRLIRKRIVEKERAKSRERDLEHAKEIEKAYDELKLTQSQLIHAEKMASLGELTAGIAHEIQNPLNFVNNFSELNTELIEELKTERLKSKNERDDHLEDALLGDIEQNLQKINFHGKRADGIVKGMLQHSRVSSGQKELTDINALLDEYLRLAYHGLRAKDKLFNAKMETDFDPSLPKINVVPQDIGRAFLNLISNAFYASSNKTDASRSESDGARAGEGGPTVWVSTEKVGNKIEIRVKDNGSGIPESIKDKIFQPFFTTKPTGAGTGLGLSLTYDIIKAHAGNLNMESEAGKGATFIIQLPIA